MNATLPNANDIHRAVARDGATLFDRIEVTASTGSTNADLAALARQGEEQSIALVAMEQTAGRGRLDRQWVSPPGASISLSLLLKPRPEFPKWGWLSILAGLAVSSAIADLAAEPARVTLKWPNDVLIGGAKVCGILSERIERPDGARAVVGIGINVSLTRDQLPVETATSLALEGLPTDLEPIISGVLRHFEDYYTTWSLSGDLREVYEARCASIGAPLTVLCDAGTSVKGIGRGVDVFGRLQVATDSGVQTFAVGDVVHARLGR